MNVTAQELQRICREAEKGADSATVILRTGDRTQTFWAGKFKIVDILSTAANAVAGAAEAIGACAIDCGNPQTNLNAFDGMVAEITKRAFALWEQEARKRITSAREGRSASEGLRGGGA